jgi:hypothetical protein
MIRLFNETDHRSVVGAKQLSGETMHGRATWVAAAA